MEISGKEFVLGIVATVLGIGGLYADDNAVKISCLLVSVVLIVYVCVVHRGPRFWRFTVAVLFIALFAVLVVHGRTRDREKAQEDVYSKLTLLPSLPSSLNVAKISVTVTNNGGSDIIEHSNKCGLHRVNLNPRGIFQNFSITTATPEKFVIKANGDADTSVCTSAFAQSVLPLACADITAMVSYSLSEQPEVTKTKEFRFVMKSDDEKWHQQPIGDTRDYCPTDWPE